MSGIVINLPAGYISAFYFVILDLFLLTLIDTVLARAACNLYYRRINAGLPISVQSADIPGVTTYLIGRYYTRANNVVYLLKFLLLGCLFYIDLGITEITHTSNVLLTGSFVFNASDSAYEGISRSVERQTERVRRCHIQKGETVEFYQVAFNLSHGVSLQDETVSANSSQRYELNDTTLICISPEFVPEQYIRPIMSVIGCSQLEPTTCSNGTVIKRSVDLLNGIRDRSITANITLGTLSFHIGVTHYDSDGFSKIFPGYSAATKKSEMTCARSLIGRISKNSFNHFFNCMLVVYNDSTTIIERWEYDWTEKKLIRYNPGPVFNGTIAYGRIQRLIQLIAVRDRSNWISFSASIIANAVVYQPHIQTLKQYTPESEASEVSWESFILATILLILGIFSRIVTVFTVGRDKRPQLNTIDGLSSIAREEFLPSGQSNVAGGHVSLGWSSNAPGPIHFGPVLSANKSVKRPAKKEIEYG